MRHYSCQRKDGVALMRVCIKCNQERENNDFYTYPNGRKINTCKYCQKAIQKAYDIARAKKRSEEYYKLKEQNKIRKYDEITGEELKQCSTCKQWKHKNEFVVRKNSLDGYTGQCKECIKQASKVRNNKLSIEEKEKLRVAKIEYMQKYRKENKEEINRKKRKENLSQMQILSHTISSAVYRVLKGIKSDRHWEDLVGYSIQELKEHLERQFNENMTWNNIGEYWEIDHIIPLNLFHYETEQDKQFQICWSLANLRPLEKIANKSRPKDGSDISKEQAINILGLDLYYDMMGVENKGGL